jgi:transcriptional regulator with XRE-family HTH domain
MAKRRDPSHIQLCDRIQKDFGRRLQQERERQRLLQKNLAYGMGLTRTSISNIERGAQRLYLDQVYQAARILQVEVTTLLPEAKHIYDQPIITSVSDDPLPANVVRQAQEIVQSLAAPRRQGHPRKGAPRR